MSSILFVFVIICIIGSTPFAINQIDHLCDQWLDKTDKPYEPGFVEHILIFVISMCVLILVVHTLVKVTGL